MFGNNGNYNSAANDTLELEAYECIPAGMYRGRLESVENRETQFGPSLRFQWRIVGGESDGASFSSFANKRLLPKSKLAKWVLAHLGINVFPEGFTLRVSSLLGKEVLLTIGVEPRKDGSGDYNVLRACDPVKIATKKPTSTKPQAQQFVDLEDDDIPDPGEPMQRGERRIED